MKILNKKIAGKWAFLLTTTAILASPLAGSGFARADTDCQSTGAGVVCDAANEAAEAAQEIVQDAVEGAANEIVNEATEAIVPQITSGNSTATTAQNLDQLIQNALSGLDTEIQGDIQNLLAALIPTLIENLAEQIATNQTSQNEALQDLQDDLAELRERLEQIEGVAQQLADQANENNGNDQGNKAASGGETAKMMLDMFKQMAMGNINKIMAGQDAQDGFQAPNLGGMNSPTPNFDPNAPTDGDSVLSVKNAHPGPSAENANIKSQKSLFDQVWRDWRTKTVVPIDPKLLATLDSAEKLLSSKGYEEGAFEWTLNSGYRTPASNRKVGGASKSQHMRATAGDTTLRGRKGGRSVKVPLAEQEAALCKIIKKNGGGGIGLYSTFVHVDTRSSKADWQKSNCWSRS